MRWQMKTDCDSWLTDLTDLTDSKTKTCLWLRMWPSDQADWSQTYCLADWSSHKLNSNFSQSSFRAIFVNQWNSLSQKLSVICLMMQYENKSSLFGYFCSEIALSKNPEIAAISFRIDKQFSAVHNRPSVATSNSAPCSSLKLLKLI